MGKKSKQRRLAEDRKEAWECMLLSEEVLKKDWDNKEDEVWNDA
jgi:hypothetical protein